MWRAGWERKGPRDRTGEGLKDCMVGAGDEVIFSRQAKLNPQTLSVFKFPFCIFSPNYSTRLLTPTCMNIWLTVYVYVCGHKSSVSSDQNER